MANLTAVSYLRHFTCYNTRPQLKENPNLVYPTCVLFLLSSVSGGGESLFSLSCNLLPCWRASPHCHLKQRRCPKLSRPPTLQQLSPTHPSPAAPTHLIHPISQTCQKIIQSNHPSWTFPTPLFMRNTCRRFVLKEVKEKRKRARDLGASAHCCRSP